MPFPWAAAMHFGLGLLRLAPRDFWALSLPEFRALTARHALPEAPNRAGLERLMAEWPDKEQQWKPAE